MAFRLRCNTIIVTWSEQDTRAHRVMGFASQLRQRIGEERFGLLQVTHSARGSPQRFLAPPHLFVSLGLASYKQARNFRLSLRDADPVPLSTILPHTLIPCHTIRSEQP
jgi:hypothetical protein